MPIRVLLALVLLAQSGLDRLGEVPEESFVTTATHGSRAAIAFASAEDPGGPTTIRWVEGFDTPHRSIELPGSIRALAYAPNDRSLFALHHRAGRKGRGDTHLIRVDTELGKYRREFLLPVSSTGLTYWPDGNALLVAARDELRTVTLPAYRSGSLFRIPGGNRAIGVVEGSRILVGQTDRVALVDLSDTPHRESMPILRTWEVTAPVVSLRRTSPDTITVTVLDGRSTNIDVAPLIAAAPPAAPRASPPEPIIARIEPEAPVDDEPVVAIAPKIEAPKVEAPKVEAPPVEAPPVEHPAATRHKPVPVAAPRPEPEHQVFGTIVGDAAGSVVAVVISGPDSIFREAARVRVDASGNWFVDGLADGRYRAQVDAGGGRVVLTRPPFLIFEIEGDRAVSAAPIEAVRVH